MTGAPLVSVIMAHHNGAAYLTDAVRSVQAQTLEDWELILIDDASTDDSLEIALALAQDEPRMRILAQSANRGPGAARNRGLDAARGDWIAVLDSDDAMAPGRLERLLARAQDSRASIVADNQSICSAELKPERAYLSGADLKALGRVDLTRFIASGQLYSSYPDLGFLKPLIQARAVRRFGARYDEHTRIGEDFHFLLRLLAAGLDIELEPQALYFYRKHPASVSHRLSQDKIAAMIAADQRFLDRTAVLAPPARRALVQRIEGLRSWSAHERLMAALKAGRWGAAFRAFLGRPHAWRLMSRPFRARLGRAWRRATEGAPQPVGRPS